jgi:large subunit ribosomal protein L6
MSAETQTSTPVRKQSRIGKRPVPVPKGVTVNISGSKVDVQGPKGKLSQELPGSISITREGDVLSVQSSAKGRDAIRLQGLGRALLASMVKGAAEGYERTLDLVGTGYRAEVKGRTITLQLGLSHPSAYALPEGVSAVVPGDSKGAVLVLSSADKARLGQVAASLRSLRPPEPYGGKGVRYRGEQIRRKAGKAGKGRK